MYSNLNELITKQNMDKKEVYQHIGITNAATVDELSFAQAVELHKKFFWEYSFEFLFEKRS